MEMCIAFLYEYAFLCVCVFYFLPHSLMVVVVEVPVSYVIS